MKKVVVVGCSSLIVSVAELLNPLEMKVVRRYPKRGMERLQ